MERLGHAQPEAAASSSHTVRRTAQTERDGSTGPRRTVSDKGITLERSDQKTQARRLRLTPDRQPAWPQQPTSRCGRCHSLAGPSGRLERDKSRRREPQCVMEQRRRDQKAALYTRAKTLARHGGAGVVADDASTMHSDLTGAHGRSTSIRKIAHAPKRGAKFSWQPSMRADAPSHGLLIRVLIVVEEEVDAVAEGEHHHDARSGESDRAEAIATHI